MLCPYCNSNNIRHLKVHILNPIGARKNYAYNVNKNLLNIQNLIKIII
jgi:hypothetical protein